MPRLAIIRHGQSLWNAQNRFTGWVDVPLTEQGEAEARAAGDRLASSGVGWDVAYTSVLQRATHTCDLAMEAAGITVPIIRDEALNERHYGDLQGLNKKATIDRFGEHVVHVWRRSFAIPPPNGEALKDTAQRTLPFFRAAIMGDIADGRNVLLFAHGNSNRSIVMELDKLDEEGVMDVELATGVPVVYDLATDGTVLGKEVWS
ncbi:MAG: 2,3-bisphosphoglycerate-dependent phosphoglycerate mutase [Myxococcota bacterium]